MPQRKRIHSGRFGYRGRWDAIDDFLKTERAKERGLRGKVDVINAAVRELLVKFGYKEKKEEPKE